MTSGLMIFDCDGVLVDTEAPVNQVISNNLSRYGLRIPPEDCHSLFTGGTMMDVRDEVIKRGVALPHNWIEEIYVEIFARLEWLLWICPRGINGRHKSRWCLASARTFRSCRQVEYIIN